MVAAETSDTAGGNFPDVEKGIAGQYYLKTREQTLFREEILVSEQPRMEGGRVVCVSRLGLGEVSHGAHMKSFSWFYRRVYGVLGSLGEHGCSRIAVTDWRLMSI